MSLQALGDRIDTILDGGPCPIGLESTVLDLTGPAPRLLRPGGLVRSRDRGGVGRLRRRRIRAQGEAALSPGQQASHYAPARPRAPRCALGRAR